jgi:hypothetical protein
VAEGDVSKAVKTEANPSSAPSSDQPAPLLLTKPGQKFQTPTPGDADRVFYESLHRQNPSSPMAQNYVIEYGVLPMSDATELYKIYMERKRNPQAQPRAVVKKSRPKSTPMIIDETGGDTGFEGGGGMEGIGRGAL